MALAQVQSLTLFWKRLGEHVVRLIRERAHAKIVITFRDGAIPLIEINRSYLPDNLPEV